MGKKIYVYTFTCESCGKEKTIKSESELVDDILPYQWIILSAGSGKHTVCSNRCRIVLFDRICKTGK